MSEKQGDDDRRRMMDDDERQDAADDEYERQDVENAAKPAAIFADTYFVTAFPGYVRIAFGEQMGGVSRYSFAVVLPEGDAEALCRDIPTVIERVKNRERKKQ